MQWFTCLNNEELLLPFCVALQSCPRHLLQPVVVYDRTLLSAESLRWWLPWLNRKGVTAIPHRLSFLDLIDSKYANPVERRTAAGAFLRCDVPWLCQEQFCLYTDVDVLFWNFTEEYTRAKPAYLAAGPQFDPANYKYFNSGVLLLNNFALRRSYGQLMHDIKTGTSPDYDQGHLNNVYKSIYDNLSPTMNWKPYWGMNPDAAIVHFHGPKPWSASTYLADMQIGGFAAYCELYEDLKKKIDFS